MTEPDKRRVWPSYRARFTIVALYALMNLYLIFGLEPLRTGQLTNIPDDKLDRFDPVAELPAIQRMVGPNAVYQRLTVEGLRPDGTISLRDGDANQYSYANYTFSVPDGQGGHKRVEISARPPGWRFDGSKLALLRLRWARGISSYTAVGEASPKPAQLPTCPLPAMLERAQRMAWHTSGALPPFGGVELVHDGQAYEIILKDAIGPDAKPIATIGGAGGAGRVRSPKTEYFLVQAATVDFGADCKYQL